MYLLFPGRHHLMSQFQFEYLTQKIQEFNVEGVVFAVTSSNHSGTKRNPIPFYLRAMMLQSFSKDLSVPAYVYGIDDVGILDDFATYTLKQLKHQSDGKLDFTPANCKVVCSTPVMEMYKDIGFEILTAEFDEANAGYKTQLPWDLLESIIESKSWLKNKSLLEKIHISSAKIWETYNLAEKVMNILSDPIITEDGDLTESRDYSSYVRQMDEIAELKYKETAPFIEAGIIGDIGCAVGSWIKQASDDQKLGESDFYGIELARQLFEICNQRKLNGEFGNPNVFFAQKNAVTSLVFERGAMSTIHTSSLTHEIESYGGRPDLLSFISNRYEELRYGGVWINRDVIGPENGDQIVLMKLNQQDGSNKSFDKNIEDQKALAEYLNGLSTYSLFKRFVLDFRKSESDQITYEEVEIDGQKYFKLKHKDAAEFMLTKDYTDNWNSEMHERFCFWSYSDWGKELEKAGFIIDAASHDYTNPWIAENRFIGKAELFTEELEKLNNPPTNALMIARKA